MNEQPLWRLIAGRKMGPYEPAKLRPLVKDGRIGPLDRFSYDGVSWAPANDFPELLRAPARPTAAPAVESSTLDPFEADASFVEVDAPVEAMQTVAVAGRASRDDVGAIDDTKLIRAISMLIAFGGGMFVLLIGYIVIASLWRPAPPDAPRAENKGQAAQPAADGAEAAGSETSE